MASVTPKQQYETSLQAILQIVMDMPQVSDADWMAISGHTGTLWGLRDRLDAVRQQVIIIRENRYYRERVVATPQTMMLTAQEKATSDEYTHCEWCKRIVKRSYVNTHQLETKVCLDIRLALEMEKRYLNSKVAWKRKIHRFFEKYCKTFQVVHYFVQQRLHQKDPQGFWWVYNLDEVVFDNVRLNPFRKSVIG
jgi:hypothetical protein